jgi:D-alanyl-D-alanine carboxypeptidase
VSKTGYASVKRLLCLLCAVMLLTATAVGGADAAGKKQRKNQPNEKYASIVIDAATGVVLSERNPDKILHPASLTKMMTLYLTFEAIQQGTLRKTQRLSVSSHAASQPPSKIGLEPGDTIRVEDAIYSLVTRSANDIAVVVAEGIGGSEPRFARLMTAKAKQLGMRNTNFVNAHGLHNPQQISTARDMAVLSRALMRDYPNEYRYFKTNRFVYAGTAYRNHNRLLESYEGMDGIKTGYVAASGYNLAASAVRDGRRLIGVVFGGRTGTSRNEHMAELLDAGFARLGSPQVARRITEQTQLAEVRLPVRKPGTVAAVTAVDRALAGTKVAMNPEIRGDDDDDTNTGLVGVEQGGRDGSGSDSLFIKGNLAAKGPRIIHNMAPATGSGPVRQTLGADVWSVQVGAFSTHDAGLSALRGVRDKLPKTISGHSQYIIAPLMTSRGVIYRARLSGLSRDQATQACRILKDNCLILAAQ